MHRIQISCKAYCKYLHTLLQGKRDDLSFVKQECQKRQEYYDALPWYRRWYHFNPNNPGNNRGLKWQISDLERDIRKIAVYKRLIETELSQKRAADYYYFTFSSEDSTHRLEEIETILSYEV